MSPFKSVRTSQPQGKYTLNSSNPITKDLIALFDPIRKIELLTGVNPYTTDTGIIVGRSGLAANYPNTIAKQQYVYEQPWSNSKKITLFVLVDINAYTNYTHFVSSSYSDSQWVEFHFGLGSTSTGNELEFRRGNASGTNKYTSTTSNASNISLTKTNALCVTVSSSSLTLATHYAYCNGIKYLLDTSTGGFTGTASSVDSDVILGRNWSGTAQLDGKIYFVAWWRRALDETEVVSLSRNPWQLFAPQERQIWVGAGGTGGNLIVNEVTITRPSTDDIVTGWTATPGAGFADMLDEEAYSDTDYITSPTVGTGSPITLGLTQTLDAGTWDIRIRVKKSGTTGQVRVHLVDGTETVQGTSSWQALDANFTTYTLQVTSSASTSKVKIEVQA